MILIKQSDATKVIQVYMADSATPTAGKAGASLTVRVAKNGAAFAAGGGTVSEQEGGFYAYTPSAGDTGTLGPLAIRATAAGCVDFVGVRQVVAFDPYSAASLGLGNLDAAVSSRSTYAGGAVASVTAPVTAGTVTDKTGYALSGAGVTAVQSGLSTYAGGDTAGTTSLLARLTTTRAGYLDNLSAGAVALASQIPANFTTALFASPGVFATAALANAPSSGGGGSAPTTAQIVAAMDADSTKLAVLPASFPANFAALAIASGTGYVTATNGGGGGGSSPSQVLASGEVESAASATSFTASGDYLRAPVGGYKRQRIKFISGADVEDAAANQDEVAEITGDTGTSPNRVITIKASQAFTNVPVVGDKFIIY